MFAYLRYFSIIALVAIIVTAVFVGKSFKETASQDLIRLIDDNNKALALGFRNSVWKKHSVTIQDAIMRLKANNISPSDWGRYAVFNEFAKEAQLYFEGMPFVEVNLYTPDNMAYLSFTPTGLITKPMVGAGVSENAKNGTASSQMQEKPITAPDGKIKNDGRTVISQVPIISDGFVDVVVGGSDTKKENIEAIIEIAYDITEQWQKLDIFQVYGTGGIILIFVLVLIGLIFTSSRMESIISKQHETNLELAAQAAAAESENREKSQFLANVSHELRTPLNAIIGFSEIIKNEVMGPLGNNQYNDYVRDIHSSGVHLLSLINDILDYSKAEAGKLELDVSEVDVTKVIQNSMRLVSPRAEHAKVRLVEDLPKEHFILHTDAKKLKQVLLNLLSNAVKFTPANGEVRVTAWQNVVDDTVSVEVKDTGIGIAPKDISRAMAPFGQVDNALSRRYEGTGLGLPLTKKFVELMGGTFSIQSEVNVGTTITISLLKHAGKTQEAAAPQSAKAEKKAEPAAEAKQTAAAAKPAAPEVPPANAASA